MLRSTSLPARLCFAVVLAAAAAAPAGAQSAPGSEDRRESPAAVEKPAAEKDLPADAGDAPSPDEAADRKEAEAAEKAAASREAPPPPVAETVVPVETIDPVIVELRQRLATAKLADVTAAERAAITAFYTERKSPIWVVGGDFTDRARHVMAEIARADDWGLDAKAFTLPGAGETVSIAGMVDAEIKLNIAVLKYARYARGGRLEPSQVSRNFDQKLSLRDPKVVLETVAGLETPGSYLRALHPKHPQFELLRQALIKVRAGVGGTPQEAETVVKLPGNGPTLKLGVEHPDVALLRKRLKIAATAGAENVFDEDVLAAVKAYQRKGGMREDGVVGAGTRSALNGGSTKSKVFGSDAERLVLNMERWRWMPEDLGEFHVWDNVPEFMTRVLKAGRQIHQAKIIVGRVQTQTTIFSANMRYIVFGPEWGVPDSIKVKELLPKLRSSSGGGGFFGNWGTTDTTILDQQNMRVVHKGKVVDASAIDWSTVDIRKYSFIQAAGPANALGAVKFRFPNKHDIYMHDTPMRHLFSQTVRSFSHGCVRVQDPGRFAEVLLEEDKGWPASRVREMMARGGNVEVTLSKQIPVHITYFTAVATEEGAVTYFSDLYGHDQRLAAAMSGRAMPLEAAPSLDIAQEDDPTYNRKEAKSAKRKQQQDSADLFSILFAN
jgi:murein L,D-transpeptidase YcbB/YkuD